MMMPFKRLVALLIPLYFLAPFQGARPTSIYT
jgi:hypothetical protein